MKANEVKDAICGVDEVTKKAGVFTARRGFFYRNGGSAQDVVAKVKAAFPNAVVLETGEVDKPFKGGAPVSKQSHWFVKFQLPA